MATIYASKINFPILGWFRFKLSLKRQLKLYTVAYMIIMLRAVVPVAVTVVCFFHRDEPWWCVWWWEGAAGEER